MHQRQKRYRGNLKSRGFKFVQVMLPSDVKFSKQDRELLKSGYFTISDSRVGRISAEKTSPASIRSEVDQKIPELAGTFNNESLRQAVKRFDENKVSE